MIESSFPPPDKWHENHLLMQGCEPPPSPLLTSTSSYAPNSSSSATNHPQVHVQGQGRLKVAVLLSGGVDSSLALRLLLAAGHDCTAFYLQIWFQEDFRNTWDSCPWEEDLGFARTVCEGLQVPLVVVPLTEAYWEQVVAHSVQEIKEGRTPNPDMLCNSRVKFGAFYDYLEKQHGGEFDRVASGHYARVVREEQLTQEPPCVSSSPSYSPSSAQPVRNRDQLVRLAMTPDVVKDQTYFLAHLSPSQLSKVMFPLGPLTKPIVRQLASLANLANKERKDSQGICFLGKVKFSEFVKEHLGEWQGLIVDNESRKVLGMHQGYWFYTVGQRSGIKLSGGPWYVVKKDRDLNIVYASRSYHEGLEEGEGEGEGGMKRRRDRFETDVINWVSDLRIRMGEGDSPLMVKVRHGPHIYHCKEVELQRGASKEGGEGGWRAAKVVLDGNDQGLAPGQYAVFYQDGYCLGSAKII